MEPHSPSSSSRAEEPTTVFLSNLPLYMDQVALLSTCSRYGDILDATLVPDGATRKALVLFASAQQAAQAIRGIVFLRRLSLPSLAALQDQQGDLRISATFASNTLHIQHCPANWHEQALFTAFGAFGLVLDSCIQSCHPDYGNREALVKMDCVASASRALLAMEACSRLYWNDLTGGVPLHVAFVNPSLCTSSQDRNAAGDGVAVDRSTRSDQLMGHFSPHGSVATAGQAREAPSPSKGSTGTEPVGSKNQIDHSGGLGSGSLSHAVSSTVAIHFTTANSNSGTDSSRRTVSATSSDPMGGSIHSRASQATSKSIYVSNLPPEADQLWVYERFAPYGGVLSVKMLQDQRSGCSRGVCFVNYMHSHGATSAIQSLDGIRISGRSLNVKLQAHRQSSAK